MKTLETISMSHPAKAWTELIPVCPFSVKPRVFVVLISLSLRFDRKHLFLFLLCLPVSKQGTPTKTSQINTISVDGDDRPWSVVSSYAVVAVHEEHMRNTSRWLFPAVQLAPGSFLVAMPGAPNGASSSDWFKSVDQTTIAPAVPMKSRIAHIFLQYRKRTEEGQVQVYIDKDKRTYSNQGLG